MDRHGADGYCSVYGCCCAEGDYIYVFGGHIGVNDAVALVERYSIIDNAWENLSDMKEGRSGHCAVAGPGSDIYIAGGDYVYSFEIFDTTSLLWNTEGTSPHDIPRKGDAVAVLLKDQYLVVIGGFDEDQDATADSFIYDS